MKSLEMFGDVWCPFAHVGLRAALAERSRLARVDCRLVVRAWPLEWVNGAPLSAELVAAHIRDLREQVAPELFAHFDESRFPSTSIPALLLEAAAYRKDALTGERASLALRDALFERGLDVSSDDVLRSIACELEVDLPSRLDDGAVKEDWRLGQERGVQGSPHFFCGGSEAFCPALDIARDASGHLILQRNAAQLRSFLEACFSS